MSEIIWDPQTGNYRYKDDNSYTRYPRNLNTNHYVFDQIKEENDMQIIDYHKSLSSIREIELSPLESKKHLLNHGYFNLNHCKILPSEQEIFGMKKDDYHEKNWPTRIEIPDENGTTVPHYFRPFDMSYNIENETNKIIANVICGRLFPTKMPYYIAQYNGKFGTVGIDLNHLDNVKSIRLDKYLDSKGIELNSVVDLMQAYRTGVLHNELTNSAIAQLIFSMFILPNALGEQDPNTRNAILLGPDGNNTKYDSLIRIDFEKNISSDNECKQDEYNQTRIYPFGIFNRNETEKEFKENIAQASKENLITSTEVNMILSMHKVANYAITSKNIYNVLKEATKSNQANDTDLVVDGYFSYERMSAYLKQIIKYADSYHTNIQKYFNEAVKALNIDIESDLNLLPSLDKA